MKATTIGIDLAKSLFQVYAVNEYVKPVFKKQLKRDHIAKFFANLPAALIGMEACSGAHYWARKLTGMAYRGVHVLTLESANHFYGLSGA